MQLRMLPHTLGLENEATLRDHLVIRFQPLKNGMAPIRYRAKLYLTQLETSFPALDREEHVVPLADRLHGCLRHDRAYPTLRCKVDIHVHFNTQALAGVGHLDARLSRLRIRINLRLDV